MELREGKITQMAAGGASGKLMDVSSNTPDLDFTNPGRVDIDPITKDKVNYLAIIANTPNGPKVINIIKERIP